MSSQSISAIFPQAQGSILQVQRQLSEYESGANTSHQHELSIHQTLDSLTRLCGEMDLIANNEGTRRDMWKQRIRSLLDEVHVLRTSFTRAQKQNPHSSYSQQATAAATRAQLFANAASANGSSSSSAFDALDRESTSLNRSTQMVDQLQEMGVKALESLRNQRVTLKGAHRKALDMANVLGMSNALMRVIGREDSTNAYITYACMLLTFIVVIVMWWYFR